MVTLQTHADRPGARVGRGSAAAHTGPSGAAACSKQCMQGNTGMASRAHLTPTGRPQEMVAIVCGQEGQGRRGQMSPTHGPQKLCPASLPRRAPQQQTFVGEPPARGGTRRGRGRALRQVAAVMVYAMHVSQMLISCPISAHILRRGPAGGEGSHSAISASASGSGQQRT